MAELLRERLRRLREDKGLSRSALSRATVRVGYQGVPEATIVAYETRPGQVPPADVLEALSEALGVAPDSFYEWPVAEAKRSTPRALGQIADEQAADRKQRGTSRKPRRDDDGTPGSGRAA